MRMLVFLESRFKVNCYLFKAFFLIAFYCRNSTGFVFGLL